MKNNLKDLRSTLDQTIFREDHFTEKNRNRVFEKIERYQSRWNFNLFQRIRNGYKPLLSVAACLFLLIGGIYVVIHPGEQKNNSSDMIGHQEGQKLTSGDSSTEKANAKNHQNTVQPVSKSEKEAVTQLAKKFKKAEYEVDYRKIPDDLSDVEKYMAKRVRPYLTAAAYKKLHDNGIFTRPTKASKHSKNRIKFDGITFEGFQRNKKNGGIDFHYQIKLDFRNKEQGHIHFLHALGLDGQMTVVHTENGWKISKDRSERLPQDWVDPQSQDNHGASK